MNKQNNTSTYDGTNWTLNTILYSLAFIALTIFTIIIYNMYIAYAGGKIESAKGLLVPLGVLISAALASTSVMKSIHNANKIEKAKNEEKIINADKYFNLILGNMKSSFSSFYSINTVGLAIKDKNLINLKEDEITTEKAKEVIKLMEEMYKLLRNPLEDFNLHLEKLLQKLETKDLIYYATNIDIIDNMLILISEILINTNFYFKINYTSEKLSTNPILYDYIHNINSFVKFTDNIKNSIIELNTYIEDEDLKIKL